MFSVSNNTYVKVYLSHLKKGFSKPEVRFASQLESSCHQLLIYRRNGSEGETQYWKNSRRVPLGKAKRDETLMYRILKILQPVTIILGNQEFQILGLHKYLHLVVHYLFCRLKIMV